MPNTQRIFPIAAVVLVAITLTGCNPQSDTADVPPTSSQPETPAFQVDPSWPQEMPNSWILGAVTAVFVDAKDHVWVTHLPETLTPEETALVQEPPIGTCCVPAPIVIEFDPAGNVVQGWGDSSTQDVS